MLDGHGADEIFGGYNGYPIEKLGSLIKLRDFKNAYHFVRNWGAWPNRSGLESYKNLLFALAIECNIDVNKIKDP